MQGPQELFVPVLTLLWQLDISQRTGNPLIGRANGFIYRVPSLLFKRYLASQMSADAG
jgi:hypothetical protein